MTLMQTLQMKKARHLPRKKERKRRRRGKRLAKIKIIMKE